MKINILIDLDIDESGLNEDDVKNNLVDFTRDLLSNGANEQGIGLTIMEVGYEQ